MTFAKALALPTELAVIGFSDTVVDATGYRPDHPYVETCHLPIIGPSAFVLWRRLASQVATTRAAPVLVDTTDLFLSIGLGESLERTGRGARTLARLVQFDFAYRGGRDHQLLAVRHTIGRVPAENLGRLPLSARQFHERSALGGS